LIYMFHFPPKLVQIMRGKKRETLHGHTFIATTELKKNTVRLIITP
jgi:6-pyruvoyl-tetrahydropterin synthase